MSDPTAALAAIEHEAERLLLKLEAQWHLSRKERLAVIYGSLLDTRELGAAGERRAVRMVMEHAAYRNHDYKPDSCDGCAALLADEKEALK